MFKLFSRGLPAIFAIATTALLVGFYFSAKIYSQMHAELTLAEPETIIFSRGSSIRTLANQLIEKDLLENKNYFLIWGKLNRQETRLQAGEYVIRPGSSLAELLKNMVAGNIVQHDLALIEGYTFRQILETIWQDSVITKQLENLSDEEIMTALGHEGEHPEGRFYPDTYYISRGVTDIELLNRAYLEICTI